MPPRPRHHRRRAFPVLAVLAAVVALPLAAGLTGCRTLAPTASRDAAAPTTAADETYVELWDAPWRPAGPESLYFPMSGRGREGVDLFHNHWYGANLKSMDEPALALRYPTGRGAPVSVRLLHLPSFRGPISLRLDFQVEDPPTGALPLATEAGPVPEPQTEEFVGSFSIDDFDEIAAPETLREGATTAPDPGPSPRANIVDPADWGRVMEDRRDEPPRYRILGAELVARMTHGSTGQRVSRTFTEERVRLSAEEATAYWELLRVMGIDVLPVATPDWLLGLDGCVGVLEVLSDTGYRVIHRWTPLGLPHMRLAEEREHPYFNRWAYNRTDAQLAYLETSLVERTSFGRDVLLGFDDWVHRWPVHDVVSAGDSRPVGHYAYLPDPLIPYRLHGEEDERTRITAERTQALIAARLLYFPSLLDQQGCLDDSVNLLFGRFLRRLGEAPFRLRPVAAAGQAGSDGGAGEAVASAEVRVLRLVSLPEVGYRRSLRLERPGTANEFGAVPARVGTLTARRITTRDRGELRGPPGVAMDARIDVRTGIIHRVLGTAEALIADFPTDLSVPPGAVNERADLLLETLDAAGQHRVLRVCTFADWTAEDLARLHQTAPAFDLAAYREALAPLLALRDDLLRLATPAHPGSGAESPSEHQPPPDDSTEN